MTNKTFYKQVGGSHYKTMKIQPSIFINENKLPFAEGNAIKYICRHSLKGKKEDVLKAIHYLEMIIERDYNENKKS
jgi:Protein of unknwon function (DUF3310)